MVDVKADAGRQIIGPSIATTPAKEALRDLVVQRWLHRAEAPAHRHRDAPNGDAVTPASACGSST